MTPERTLTAATWCLRLALSATLLSAVADRFGLWGPHGSPNASWGDWSHFVSYCAQVNGFLPASLAAPLAWTATALETVFGIAFLAGFFLRVAAYGSAILLALFAVAMTISMGVKAPLNYSVFVDAAAALLLGALLEIRRQTS